MLTEETLIAAASCAIAVAVLVLAWQGHYTAAWVAVAVNVAILVGAKTFKRRR